MTVSFRRPLRCWLILLSSLVVTISLVLAADEPSAVIATLKGHSETIYAVAFSPDGKQVATASFDRTVRLWDTTGKELKSFGGPTGHQNLVLSLTFSPDGQYLASGASDNTAKIWDVPISSPLRDLAQSDAVTAVTASADGKLLAAGCKDGSVKLITPTDGKQLFNLTGHSGPVTSVNLSNNAQLLATAGSDRTVRIWNAVSGQPVGVLTAHTGPVSAVAFHPNGTSLFSIGTDGALKFWQLPITPPRALPSHADAVTSLAVAGDQVVTGSADKTVRISTISNGQPVRQLQGPTAAVGSVALGPNSAAAAGAANGELFVWGNDGKLLNHNIAHTGGVSSVGFAPQGNQLLTTGGDGLVKLWAFPPAPARAIPHPEAVLAIAMTTDGKRLVTGAADKVVRLISAATGQVERQLSGHTAPVSTVAINADAQVIVSGSIDGTIRFWNRESGQTVANIGAHTGPLTSLALHANAQQVLSASADGAVKLWQLPQKLAKPLVHPDQVISTAVSPDGTKLLTGCADKQVRVWDIASGTAKTFGSPTVAITAVAFSPTGALIAAAGADKSLTVWNFVDGKEVKKAMLPAAIQALALSVDGKFASAGLSDNSIQLVDLTMGKVTKTLTGHTGPVAELTYTPKGDQLVSVSADKSARVWDIAAGSAKTTIDHGAPILSMALTKDGTKLVTAGTDKTIKLWTLADGKPAGTIASLAEIRGVALSPDGSRLVVGGADSQARLYGLDGTLLEFFTHEGPVVGVGFAGDARRVITASSDKSARLWQSALLWAGKHDGPVRQAVLSPKGDIALSSGDDKVVKVWNLADGKVLAKLTTDSTIAALGIAPDGTKLITASADKQLKLWPVPKSGTSVDKPAQTVPLPGVPTGLAFSPNGARVAVAVTEGNTAPVLVFDLATGKELTRITGHTGAIHGLIFAADNRTLATASADKTARLSDVNLTAVFDAHAGGVASALYNPGGTQILTGGADKAVKIWDVTSAKVVKTFGPLTEPITQVAWSRDTQQICAAAGSQVTMWTVADGKEVISLTQSAAVTALAFGQDRTRLLTGGADSLARVWDTATGKELQAFAHTGRVNGVALLPDNKSVLSASADKTIAINTIAAQRVIPASTAMLRTLVVNASGSQVLTAGDEKGIKIWNAGTGAAERTVQVDVAITAMAISRNGILLAAGCADKSVRLFTLSDGKPVSSFKTTGGIRGLSFSPNNAVLAAGCDDNTVPTWNVVYATGQPTPPDFGKALQSFGHAAAVADVVFATDALLVSGGQDKAIKAWKLASDTPAKSLSLPNLVDAVGFDPGGTILATGCHDGTVRTWDIAKGTQLKQINAHTQPAVAPVYAVAYSPDGKQLVSCSLDRSIKIWDANTAMLIRELKPYKEKEAEHGHRDGVFTVAYSPDGKLLASGGSDRSIKLWNVADGNFLRDCISPNAKPTATPNVPTPPQAHPGWVYSVRFTPDGKRLVSAGNAPRNQGYLAVWNVADGTLLDGQELPLGAFYSVAVAPDGKSAAIGSGPRGRQFADVNAYILRLPAGTK